MTVTVGKYPDVQAFPFGQLVGMYRDAQTAREHYQELQADSALTGLIISDDNDIQALVLYRDDDGDVTLEAALAWRNVQLMTVFDEMMTYFSKLRKKTLTVQTFAEMDVKHLSQHDFVATGDRTYTKTFSYPVAIVFGGGGAHGAFLTGAYEVLHEHGIRAQEMLGVSVGAITGMSLMHYDTSASKETWEKLTTDMVYEVDEVGLNNLAFTKSLAHNFVTRQYFNKESLRNVIRPVVEKELATPRLADFTLVTTEFPLLKETTYTVTDATTVDELTDWILASSAFYPLVSPVEIDGKRYIDGGYTNNVPVDIAAAHGAKEIYAMSIMDAAPEGSTVPEDVVIHKIRSPWELGPLLDFMPEESARHMRLGELRARQVLGDLDGYYYAFEPGVDFAWLGGAQLVKWLATDPVTAPIAELLTHAPIWMAWTQWLQGHMVDSSDHSESALGLAVIERLAEILDVDPLTVYSESTFQAAIVAAGQNRRGKLPLPMGDISRPYLLANMAVVLTGVLFLLSKWQKTSKINN